MLDAKYEPVLADDGIMATYSTRFSSNKLISGILASTSKSSFVWGDVVLVEQMSDMRRGSGQTITAFVIFPIAIQPHRWSQEGERT